MNCSINDNYQVLLMDQTMKISFLSLFVYYFVLIVTLWIILEQLSRDSSVGIKTGYTLNG
jgi:hypothetical protein